MWCWPDEWGHMRPADDPYWNARLDLLISEMQSLDYDPANLDAVIEAAKIYPTANYSLPILLALKRIEDGLNQRISCNIPGYEQNAK